MSESHLDEAGPPLGARRRDVLQHVRQAPVPQTAADVAGALGMHLNTARFHLDALAEQEYVDRRAEERRTPGRPRVLYSARPAGPGPRGYRRLSGVLAAVVATLDPRGEQVAEAGRGWGRSLASETPAGADPLARLHEVMDVVGFAPETLPDVGEVRLHHCPFLEVATDRPEVVCRLHLGLVQGALEELAAPWAVERLVPFATPQVCVAHLAGKGAAGPAVQPSNEGAP